MARFVFQYGPSCALISAILPPNITHIARQYDLYYNAVSI